MIFDDLYQYFLIGYAAAGHPPAGTASLMLTKASMYHVILILLSTFSMILLLYLKEFTWI